MAPNRGQGRGRDGRGGGTKTSPKGVKVLKLKKNCVKSNMAAGCSNMAACTSVGVERVEEQVRI